MKSSTALAAAVSAAALALGCGGSGGPTAVDARTAGPFVPDAPHARAVLWALGDAVPGPGAPGVARLVSRARVDTLLYLGDVYPLGTAEAFRTGYAPVFGRLARRTAPTPGNHDWPVHRSGYDAYWRRIHGRTPPPWYSFTAGGWRILALNSETDARAAQLRWLHGATRTGGTCRLAFMHRPRFSAGPHGDNADLQPYWSALRGHARLLLAGHDHDMQRFPPRQGIVQLVAGAGGHGHYPLNRSGRRPAFGDDTHYGALRITLRPGRALVDFVAAGGRVLDRSLVRCRR